MGILCVSVDLDEIRCYHEIHGLDPDAARAGTIYERAVPRIARFLSDRGIGATFFAVGRDLRTSGAAQAIRGLAADGHEISNHTMNHRYDLTLLPSREQEEEIRGGAEAIRAVTAADPPGFRAPGYNVHLGLLDLVRDAGHSYDSSVFPCPSYTAAKAAAMGWKRLRGNPSRSILGDPRILLAPNMPYRLGRDGVWTRGDGLCELPITVVTPARLPFIGTSISLMGRKIARVISRSAARMGFVNLELHGIDFIDAAGDGLSHLEEYQPDLRISLGNKTEAIGAVIDVLLDSGMQAMTLEEASTRVFV